MAKFTAIVLATAALFAGAQAGVASRAVTCPPGGGVICGFQGSQYGITRDTLQSLIPNNGGQIEDNLFNCQDGVVTLFDRCVPGECVGYRARDNINGFCDIYYPDSA